MGQKILPFSVNHPNSRNISLWIYNVGYPVGKKDVSSFFGISEKEALKALKSLPEIKEIVCEFKDVEGCFYVTVTGFKDGYEKRVPPYSSRKSNDERITRFLREWR